MASWAEDRSYRAGISFGQGTVMTTLARNLCEEDYNKVRQILIDHQDEWDFPMIKMPDYFTLKNNVNGKNTYSEAIEDFDIKVHQWNKKSAKRIPYVAIQIILNEMRQRR